MGRAERVESELVSLADWIERYFASRDLLPPPAIAAGVASARAALALPADAPAQPAPEGAGEAVALPMRGDVGKPEATRDPIFLLRWRPRNRPIRGDRWTVEGVWFTREEAEEFARGHAYRWGSDKHGPCWQVYCVPADGTLAALLRARTAYNVAKVPPLYAHPTPRAEAASAEVVASVLPLADGLLRDAEDAIAAHAGPGQHVGTPKVTVDALRLRNVARAVAHALLAGGSINARIAQPERP